MLFVFLVFALIMLNCALIMPNHALIVLNHALIMLNRAYTRIPIGSGKPPLGFGACNEAILQNQSGFVPHCKSRLLVAFPTPQQPRQQAPRAERGLELVPQACGLIFEKK